MKDPYQFSKKATWELEALAKCRVFPWEALSTYGIDLQRRIDTAKAELARRNRQQKGNKSC